MIDVACTGARMRGSIPIWLLDLNKNDLNEDFPMLQLVANEMSRVEGYGFRQVPLDT
jgi:hypothetical protein